MRLPYTPSYTGLDEQDQAVFESAYERLVPENQKILWATPRQAGDIAANRAEIEAACQRIQHDGRMAFRRIVDNETHYEMERMGYLWSDENVQFEQPDGRPATIYNETRTRIIEALALRVGEYFQNCTVHRAMPQHGAFEDFGVPLQEYLKRLPQSDPVTPKPLEKPDLVGAEPRTPV